MMNGFNSPMGVKSSNQQGLFTAHQHQLPQQPQSQPQSQISGSGVNTGHQQYSNQPPQSTSSPPAMESPYRGATRKLGGDMGSASGPSGMKMPGMGGPGSPRIGGGLSLGGQNSTGGLGLGAGIMGPPGLPRTVSGDTMMMGNANSGNINMINGRSPRPQSSMDMNADIASRLGIPPPSSQQQHQRQGSIPPQFSNPQQQQQQQMRQGSLPPGTGPGLQQQQRQKMGQDGMNMSIGGGGMGMNMGGGMGMGMKPNNDMRAGMPPTSTTPMNMMGMSGLNSMGSMGSIGNMSGMGGMNPMNMTMNIPPAPHSTSSTSSVPHMPASPLLGGGGPGPQGMVPSLSVSSIGSNIAGGQTTIPSIQTPSMEPDISSTPASNSGPAAAGAAPGTSPTPIASTSTAATGASSNPSLPPLPPVNPSTTQITTFPLSTSHLHIPVLTSPEISQIKGWMKEDQEYEAFLGKSKERMVEEVREALGTSSSGSGVGGTAAPGWWEMPATGNYNRWRRRGEMFEVRYPRTKREREREREREGRGKKSLRREGLKLYVSFSCFRLV